MRIVYTCPEINKIVGGAKVIYRHSQIINENINSSCVYHSVKDFSYNWFSHSATIIHDGINKDNDFVIIPEADALLTGQQCLNFGIKYAIFVQNVLGIQSENSYFLSSELKNIYYNASFVIAISSYAKNYISFVFNDFSPEKILLVNPSIPFVSDISKHNIISYMPRKLPYHANLVTQILRSKIPPLWSLCPIDNVDENTVLKVLSQSSIFLSFADLDSLSLPPLEAALSGNVVVGYTGEGGKDYFVEPVFRSVSNGDFIDFVEKTVIAISDVENDILNSESFVNVVKSLSLKYSSQSELNSLNQLVSKIKKIF